MGFFNWFKKESNLHLPMCVSMETDVCYEGEVERIGYCHPIVYDHGFYLILLKGFPKPFRIWCVGQNFHQIQVIAMTQPGDRVAFAYMDKVCVTFENHQIKERLTPHKDHGKRSI